MRSHLARAIAALGLAVAAAWVPLVDAAACSCAFSGHAEAMRAADWAFVGTVVHVDEPQQERGFGTATYAFGVERAKSPMDTPFSVDSIFGGGANCGFDMAVGERWLIMATVHEGRPTTNLCAGSTTMESLDPDAAARVEEALLVVPEQAEAAATPALSVPLPTIIVALGAIVIALGCWIAFRRASAT